MTSARDFETTLFEDAVDVPIWLEADRTTPLSERRQRDRKIALEIDARDRAERVRAWWRKVDAPSRPDAGRRLAAARRLATFAMLLVGALAGAGVALAAFRYDGTQPVNVVRILALLVVPQIVLVALTLVMMPPRVPGLKLVQDALASMNPGALAASIFRSLARDLGDLPHLMRGGRPASRRYAKWQLLYWSQAAAVAFNVAALATAFALITFTDLAFGWSTTLGVEPALVARIVELLAWPWKGIFPEAVPDLALIEQSRFFRLEGAERLAAGASRELAGWWSFTVLAIACYGLVPRIVLLGIASWRLGAATRALLVDDPRVTALLDRMDAPALETAATEHDDGRPEAGPAAPRTPAPLTGRARGVIWSRGIDSDTVRRYARERLGLELARLVEAGDSPDLDADRRAAEQITNGDGPLVVFTPAWEPPLLEFLDFLSMLREHAGPHASIVVMPVGEANEPVGDVERETWARAVGKLADPKVYVETASA